MRVGVDATSWGNLRGFGRFARNAVGRLIDLDKENRYVLFIDEEGASHVELPANAEHRHVTLGRPPSEAAAADSSRSPVDLLRLTRAVSGTGLDAFLFPSVYTWFPVLRVPTVVGVHDVIAQQHPESTLPSRRARAFWQIKEGLAIRTATSVFTVSEASRDALVERFGLTPERLAIVPEAPDPVFSPRSEDEVASDLSLLGLERDRFFLFVGGISPHKNLPTLLEAYARLRRARTETPPLVLVGELDSDPYMSATAVVRARIARLGLEDHVVLTGFVSDETLARLYTGATAVVLPSLAEGFDLPAVEAAACGAAIVLSELPAHRETLDGAAVFFAATDAPWLSTELGRVLDDPEMRRTLARKGRAAVAPLSWDAAAERLGEVLAEAVAAGPRRRWRAGRVGSQARGTLG